MADKFVRLSQTPISSRLTKLGLNSRFAALTEDQRVAMVNSADQQVCDLYNAADKPDYEVTTSMEIIPV